MADNVNMNANHPLPPDDPDTDAVIAMLMTGAPIPNEIRDRLRAEGERISKELRETFGETTMAAELIREAREE